MVKDKEKDDFGDYTSTKADNKKGVDVAVKDAETVSRYAPDETTKKEADLVAQEGKYENYKGGRVEKQGDGFICREEKGTGGSCGTVLKDDRELRDHLIHIHQKTIPFEPNPKETPKK